MSQALRRFVRERAGDRCEYCRLPDFAAPLSTFHVEHVFAKQHGGSDGPESRCWSCHRCNLHKGPNLSGRDPVSETVVRLFNPRRQSWARHFQWARPRRSYPDGPATVAVLATNDPARVELRQLLMEEGEWPGE